MRPYEHILLAVTTILLGSGVAPAQGWGTVKGQIVWGGGAIPARKELNVTKDQTACLAKGKLLDEDWVVNEKNKGIQWTYVWLTPKDKGGKMPIHADLEKIKKKQETLDQPCCQFEPHALALREGQGLIVKNSATIVHNVKWGSINNAGGNVIVPAGGTYAINNLVTDKYPVQVECNIHPWMKGWIRIFDHPYFAVTDSDGNFEFKNAPAGEYRLMIWHESAGFRGGKAGRDGQLIAIKKDGTVDLGKLDLKPES